MIEVTLSVLAALVAFVPFGDLAVLGAPVAWLAGTVLRIRRAQVEEAMARGVPAAGAREASAMYASLATGVMELLWLAGGAKRELATVTRFAPGAREAIAEALRGGKGAVFAASHTGNWELGACALAECVPLSVLVKRVSVRGFERFMWRLRERYGVGLLEGRGSLWAARRELLAGRVVAVLIDQVPVAEDSGDWVSFLGADALTDRAAAALAASVGAPLVVTASRRTEDGTQVLEVLGVRRPPARGVREWARESTGWATGLLEGFVRAHPAEWLWMHRRWKRAGQRYAEPGTPTAGPLPAIHAHPASGAPDSARSG